MDHFRRLEFREIVGISPRFHVIEIKPVRLVLALHYIAEFERLSNTVIPNTTTYWPDSKLSRFDQRLSAYATISTRLGERLKIAETIYFQPQLTNFTNIRTLSELEFHATVTKLVAIRFSLLSIFDSNPPDGVLSVDSTLKTTVQLNIK